MKKEFDSISVDFELEGFALGFSFANDRKNRLSTFGSIKFPFVCIVRNLTRKLLSKLFTPETAS